MKIADGKRTFIMSRDWASMINKMTMSQKAELLTAIYSFQTSGEEPIIEDPRVAVTFEYMLPTFESNEKQWEEVRETNRANAHKRWEKQNATASDSIQTQATATNREQPNANQAKTAVYGNVGVSVGVSGSVHDSALVSAGEPTSSGELTEEEKIISFIVSCINRLSGQHFPMLRSDQIENFWQIYRNCMNDPYDLEEVKKKLNLAWVNVSNQPTKLMHKFKPFEIFRDELWIEQ